MNFNNLLTALLFTTFIIAALAGDYEPTAAEKEILKQSPCSDTDSVCWARKCNEYTNAIRKEHNASLSMLELADEYMLDNAMAHSRRQAAEMDPPKIFHQSPLPKLGAGECLQQVNGENVATSWGSEGWVNNNYAYQCVAIQWKHSPGHFKNLVRDWFESAITGIVVTYYTNENGQKMKRITCTQTFAGRTFSGGVGKCAAVPAGTTTPASAPGTPLPMAPSPSPSSPANPSTNSVEDDTDKMDDDKKTDCSHFYQSINRTDASRIRILEVLKATLKDGSCQYCSILRCLTAERSEAINTMIKNQQK